MSITMPIPLPSRNPFLDPLAPTLANVCARLETAEPDPRRRGEMISAINTFARVLGHTPHELPADTALLRRLMRKALPAAAGVGASRWANVRSLVTAALVAAGLRIMPGRRLAPPSPAWAELDRRLPHRFMRAGLSRFMRWCSAEGIEPHQVDAGVFARFRAAVLNDSLLENGWATCQATVRLWNDAVGTVSGWPQALAPVVSARERYVLPLEAFSVAFQADAEAWNARLAGKAGLGLGLDVGPLKPVRPATLKKWRFAIRQLASALVAAGCEPASLTSLADLVTLEAASTILRFYLDRSGGKACAQTQSLGAALKAIARHHVGASETVLAGLRRMASKVTPPAQGMTSKNRAALRQFESEAQQYQLLTLPARLLAELPKAGPLPFRLAVKLQSALAVAILLAAPMRLRNLCRLELGRHLLKIGNGRQARWMVSIPGEEVKNGDPIELPLPERVVELIERYRQRVLPVLAPAGTIFLFPGLHGPKAEVSLGTQVPRFLERELGCRLSAHQFRHLVGFIYLQRHPDGHEVVRRMLGHRDIRTTIRFYAGMEAATAARHYEAVIDDLLNPTTGARPRKGRR